MKKLEKIILVVLALVLLVSFAACKTANNETPGTATEAVDNNTPAPTEEPVPADPLVNNWKMVPNDYEPGMELEESLELIIENDGTLYFKSAGEVVRYTWQRTDDTISFTSLWSDPETFKIIENTADKLVLSQETDYGETYKYTFIVKQLPVGKLSKNDLIGRWDYVTDSSSDGYWMQFRDNGYGEMFYGGQYFDFFSWTLENDELRVFFKTGNMRAPYFYISIEGDKLLLDNRYDGNVYAYAKNITGARAMNAVSKDQLVGMWDGSDGTANQFNADGTGIYGGYKCRWDLFGDVIELTFEEVNNGETEVFSYYYIIAISGDTLIMDDKYEVLNYTRSK
ncbi:MAG: hypothetical protein J5584_09155 [Clostridia bacterium]|nr:hypothetical protein [Clostridia bacterium]